jgi:uncharacterized protein (TIGR02118 family)
MVKLTVLYGHPIDPIEFEEYYASTHLPLAATMKGFEKVEYTKFLDGADGKKAIHYRMAEFWFKNAETLQATMASPEGEATGADLGNFATGGVKLLVGIVESK